MQGKKSINIDIHNQKTAVDSKKNAVGFEKQCAYNCGR